MRIYQTSELTTTKKAPWKGSTIDFLQLAYREQLINLVHSMAQQQGYTYNPLLPYVISGNLTSDGVNYYFTAGTVVVNGELFNFNTQTVPIVGGWYLNGIIDTAYSTPADPTLLSDLSTANLHQIRTCHFQFLPSVTGTNFNMSFFSVFQTLALQGEITPLQTAVALTPWTTVTSFGTNWANSSYPWVTRFMKDGMGWVSLQGHVASTGATPSDTLFTLPVGYRPSEDLMFPCVSWNSSTYITTYIHVSGAGAVQYNAIGALPTGSGWYVDLSPITFNTQ